jgi:hypothetical protein
VPGCDGARVRRCPGATVIVSDGDRERRCYRCGEQRRGDIERHGGRIRIEAMN